MAEMNAILKGSFSAEYAPPFKAGHIYCILHFENKGKKVGRHDFDTD